MPATPARPPLADDVVLSDARAIRALAHPARLAVLGELFAGRELTATECAEIAGLSPSAMSYHLRALESFGVVRRAEARGDSRERPWRAAGRSLRVETSARLPAAAQAAETALLDSAVDQFRADIGTWTAARQDAPAGWQELATISRGRTWLTEDEARAMVAAIDAAREPYRDRQDPTRRPAGSRPVSVFWGVVPLPDGAESDPQP